MSDPQVQIGDTVLFRDTDGKEVEATVVALHPALGQGGGGSTDTATLDVHGETEGRRVAPYSKTVQAGTYHVAGDDKETPDAPTPAPKSTRQKTNGSASPSTAVVSPGPVQPAVSNPAPQSPDIAPATPALVDTPEPETPNV